MILLISISSIASRILGWHLLFKQFSSAVHIYLLVSDAHVAPVWVHPLTFLLEELVPSETHCACGSGGITFFLRPFPVAGKADVHPVWLPPLWQYLGTICTLKQPHLLSCAAQDTQHLPFITYCKNTQHTVGLRHSHQRFFGHFKPKNQSP